MYFAVYYMFFQKIMDFKYHEIRMSQEKMILYKNKKFKFLVRM